MKKVFFALFIFISSVSFAQVNLTQGLVAYYPFNGDANDTSGNNNNPIFNNATLTSDRFGNPNSAYHFNGINNYIDIPNNPGINFGTQISICTWVRPTGFYYGRCHGNMMVSKGDYTNTGYYNLGFDDNLYTNGNNCNGSLPDTIHETFGGTLAPEVTPYIIPNEWYSVVYTNDGDSIRLYINCQLSVTYPSSVTTFTNVYDLFFGENSNNNINYPYWFNGDLDEVRIYNRAINQDEVNSYGGCPVLSTPCNNWLHLQGGNDAVTVGSLDVTGNQLTVEAIFNTTTYSRFLVSKHSQPSDVNYSLLPDGAEINAGGVYYFVGATCPWLNNKTYHVASVYDGSSFRFYRDGFLMDSVAASGSLATNSLETHIGYLASEALPQQLLGYINEVRIWNVARPLDSLKAYMNATLPNPTTQSGLLGYYTFDNLLNKQGNSAYNGTLQGSTSSINATNPDCTFLADSCGGVVPVILTDFIASTVNNKIQLSWHTEGEINIQKYTIERAIAGTSQYSMIGMVQSKSNQLANNYFFIDELAIPNVLYSYRLVIYENSGTSNYSVVKTAKISSGEFIANIYPNPSNGKMNLFINPASNNTNIKVFNNLGQRILYKKINTVGSNILLLDLSKQPKGTYWISVQTDENSTIKKVIIH